MVGRSSSLAQTAEDGEAIYQKVAERVKGTTLKVHWYGTTAYHKSVPTLYFPYDAWKGLSEQERLAVGFFLNASATKLEQSAPKERGDKEALIYDDGALYRWYIRLFDAEAVKGKSRLTKAFNFRLPANEGETVYSQDKLDLLLVHYEGPSVMERGTDGPELEVGNEPEKKPSFPTGSREGVNGKGAFALQGERAQTPEEIAMAEVAELLKKSVVARARVPIFKPVYYEGAVRTSVAEGVPSNETLREESIVKGKPLGMVRTGFLFSVEKKGLGDVLIGKALGRLGGEAEFVLSAGDFHSLTPHLAKQVGKMGPFQAIQNPLSTVTLETYSLTPDTEMLDYAEEKFVVLSNQKGSIEKAFILKGRGDGFGIAKTKAGYFYGKLRERKAGENLDAGWKQLCESRDRPFCVEPRQSQRLEKGTRLFRLAGLTASNRPVVFFKEPVQVQIYPLHYETILTGGMDGLRFQMQVPKDDGFEEEKTEDQPTKGGARGHESHVEQINEQVDVYFSDWTENALTVNVVLKRRERIIDTWYNEYRILNSTTSPWRNVNVSEVKILENDLDAGIRFMTEDGLVEVSRRDSGGSAVYVNSYQVRKNPLSR